MLQTQKTQVIFFQSWTQKLHFFASFKRSEKKPHRSLFSPLVRLVAIPSAVTMEIKKVLTCAAQHFPRLQILPTQQSKGYLNELSQIISFQDVIKELWLVLFGWFWFGFWGFFLIVWFCGCFLICHFKKHVFLLWTEHKPNPNPAHYQWDFNIAIQSVFIYSH